MHVTITEPIFLIHLMQMEISLKSTDGIVCRVFELVLDYQW